MEKGNKRRLIILAVGTVAAIAVFADIIPVILALNLIMTGAALAMGIGFLRSKGNVSAWNPNYIPQFRLNLSRVIAVVSLVTAAIWPVGELIGKAVEFDQDLLLRGQVIGMTIGLALSMIPVSLKTKQKKQK